MRRTLVVLFTAVAVTPILSGSGVAAETQEASPTVVLPVAGEPVRAFEPPTTPYGRGHRGVDLAARPGTRVAAASAGIVRFAGSVAGTGWVTVDHGGGLETTYGGVVPAVRTGRTVAAGDVIGALSSGRTHVDWGARLGGSYIDPFSLFSGWRIVLVPVENG